MIRTIYHVVDDRQIGTVTFDAERAERLSREGLTVTATTVTL